MSSGNSILSSTRILMDSDQQSYDMFCLNKLIAYFLAFLSCQFADNWSNWLRNAAMYVKKTLNVYIII